MIAGLCTVLLAFALQLRKHQKTSARRPSMKAVRQVIALNGISYLQMTSIGSHSTPGTKKGGKKERPFVKENWFRPSTEKSLQIMRIL